MPLHANPQNNQAPLPEFDIIIVGAGLAAGILALRLATLPDAPNILMLEATETPFGDKTWSFQRTDIGLEQAEWLDHAVIAEWRSQSVRFADLHRELATPYASISSAGLKRAVLETGKVTVRTGTRAVRVAPDGVQIDSDEWISAACVIDGRGHRTNPAMDLAYQKFVGMRVRTRQPHGVAAPVIMDASVPQIDGFRFVYLLPFSPDEILIEDTRYADGAALDKAAITASIEAYAAAHGWTIDAVLHREAGVLPITLAFDRKAFWAGAGDVPRIGMRGAFFHSTTGYSLADAVRVADITAEAWPVSSPALADLLHDHARRRAPRQAFYRFLNRMLFRAARPHERHLVMQKFYRLPRPTIERFYAGRTTLPDMLRILSGRPPVPIHRALRCIWEPSRPPAQAARPEAVR